MAKYTKKSTFRKPKTGMFKKRSTARKPRYSGIKRVGKPIRVADPTVIRINPGRDPIIRVKKSLVEISPFSVGVAGTNGLFLGSQGITGTVALQMLFDPTGTFGNNSTTFIGGVLTTATASIPEWLGLSALYDMYKVNKITVKFSALDIGNLDVGSPVIYVRYNNKYGAVSPVVADISNKRGWIKKTFTDAQRDFTYSFYPKVQAYNDNVAALATDSRAPVSMPWTNVSTPIEIYGLQIFAALPASINGYSINANFEYDISFKTAD